jgi:tRNA 5-methylaminomethyl-2-thiouridine biosynthesis bifunctional protein
MTKSQRNKPYFLDTVKLHWGDDGVPDSESFGDAYFSMESGIDGNRHIFLHHNQLAERWQALDKQSTGKFTIIETGFGSN